MALISNSATANAHPTPSPNSTLTAIPQLLNPAT